MYIKGTGNIENLFFKRNHVRDTASNQIFQILAFCQVHWFCLYYVSNPPTFVHFQCPYSYKKLSDNMSPSLAACYIDCCLFKLVSLYKDMSRFTFKKIISYSSKHLTTSHDLGIKRNLLLSFIKAFYYLFHSNILSHCTLILPCPLDSLIVSQGFGLSFVSLGHCLWVTSECVPHAP